MAKDKGSVNPDDEDTKKRLQEKQERDKAEKKANEQKRKEKEAKRKEKQKRIKLKEKKEIARIKILMDFPYNFLFQISAIIAIITFILLFFVNSYTLISSLVYAFFVFTGIYMSVGLVMIAVFFVISEHKKKEMEELRKKSEEEKLLNEKNKALEQAQLEEHLKEEYIKQQDTILANQKRDMGLGDDYNLNSHIDMDFDSPKKPIITPPPVELHDSSDDFQDIFGQNNMVNP